MHAVYVVVYIAFSIMCTCKCFGAVRW